MSTAASNVQTSFTHPADGSAGAAGTALTPRTRCRSLSVCSQAVQGEAATGLSTPDPVSLKRKGAAGDKQHLSKRRAAGQDADGCAPVSAGLAVRFMDFLKAVQADDWEEATRVLGLARARGAVPLKWSQAALAEFEKAPEVFREAVMDLFKTGQLQGVDDGCVCTAVSNDNMALLDAVAGVVDPDGTRRGPGWLGLTTPQGLTPLHVAARDGRRAVFQYLFHDLRGCKDWQSVITRADEALLGHVQTTLFHLGCLCPQTAVEDVVSTMATVLPLDAFWVEDGRGLSPVAYVARCGLQKVLVSMRERCRMESGLEEFLRAATHHTELGDSALSMAAGHGHVTVVEWLLELSASWDVTPLVVALTAGLENGHSGVVGLLTNVLRSRPVPEPLAYNLYRTAIIQGTMPLAQTVVMPVIPLPLHWTQRSPGEADHTSLYEIAAEMDRIECARMMLDAVVTGQCRLPEYTAGRTLLMRVASLDSPDALKLLLSHVDPKALTAAGSMALDCAASAGCLANAELLLQGGADFKEETGWRNLAGLEFVDGRLPVVEAVRLKLYNVVGKLVGAGARVDLHDGRCPPTTALDAAKGDERMEALLKTSSRRDL